MSTHFTKTCHAITVSTDDFARCFCDNSTGKWCCIATLGMTYLYENRNEKIKWDAAHSSSAIITKESLGGVEGGGGGALR